MRLLFITQTVDKDDAVLGAYHAWITALASRFERVEVICLREGVHDLPSNVSVHSLGKEGGKQHALIYAARFFWQVLSLRARYDAVFVHMNQEYLLIAGWFWKLRRIPTYFWRNHYAGSWMTDLAVAFATVVLCTSHHSYTARFKKVRFMPVGIDLARFRPDSTIERVPRSVLFLARIAPSKHPEVLIEALGILKQRDVAFSASIVGSPAPADAPYYWQLRARVRELGMDGQVTFLPSAPNERTPILYRAHEVFVNASPSGMFDKTLFEAAACGCTVLAVSDDWRREAGDALWFDGTPVSLAAALERSFGKGAADLRHLAEEHSLERLVRAFGELADPEHRYNG